MKKGAISSWPVLSLFSGAGGFDLGFLWAGFRPELAIDIDQAAVSTYKANHPGTVVVPGDLSKIDPARIVRLWRKHMGQIKPVGLIGGPPCQAFSLSNVRPRRNDPRSRLLQSYTETIREFSSYLGLDFFVFENVPGLLSHRHQNNFNQFKRQCEAAGFRLTGKILDAGRFGVPQHRKRLIVVGINEKNFPEVDFHLSDGDQLPPPVRSVLEGLPEPAFCARGSRSNAVPLHPNHIAMVPRSSKFTNGSLIEGDARGRSFRVLAWDSPSYTVAYGHREMHVHPFCHRRLSIYEAMLLQGFPTWYRLEGTFSQQVQLVSDAVPPPLAEGIAREIAKSLEYNARPEKRKGRSRALSTV